VEGGGGSGGFPVECAEGAEGQGWGGAWVGGGAVGAGVPGAMDCWMRIWRERERRSGGQGGGSKGRLHTKLFPDPGTWDTVLPLCCRKYDSR
jgi:hypothetical protein